MELSAYFQQRLAECGITNKPNYKIKEIATLSMRHPDWVRTIVKGDKHLKSSMIRGVWLTPAPEVDKWMSELHEREILRIARYSNPELFTLERRPSHVAVRMVSTKVRGDPILNDHMKALFLERLDVYRSEWDESWERRCGNAKGSTDPSI